jgi:IS30 family transposase
MPSLSLVEPARARKLNIADREHIAQGLGAEKSIRQIARELGRAPSTVLRELRKNMHHQQYRRRPGTGFAARPPWRYSPHLAQLRADKKASRPKQAKLAANPRLQAEVQDRLEHKHSPEQIARRLVSDFPDDAEMRVSHETIYQSLYVQGRGALNRELTRQLRTGRALRKPRRRPGQRLPRIKDMVSISNRPPEVEDRAVPGHWEGDLITGEQNQSAIGTLVERKTGYLMLLHLPDGHGALAVQDAMIIKMSRLPQLLRQTLTWDQGSEMAAHTAFTLATTVEAARWPTMPTSPPPPIWRSISAIRTHRGSAARMKTPTGCCGSTSPKAATCPSGARVTWTMWPPNSTTDPANVSAGAPPPKPLINYCLIQQIHQVLP